MTVAENLTLAVRRGGHRRRALAAVVVAAISAVALLMGFGCREAVPIRVGVLHSLSGTMAISARPVAESTLMAIDELNAAGGLLGRSIEPVVRDGASDPTTFAGEAERLITVDQVAATFGCWTSSCRKQVKPVIEKHQHLFFYPVQYEGLEASPFIIYNGAAPNQQIIPAVTWALDNLGRRFYLVGSDYVFPHTANAIIDTTDAIGGEIVGEAYAPGRARPRRHRRRDRTREAQRDSQYHQRRQQRGLLSGPAAGQSRPRRSPPCPSASLRRSSRQWE